MRLIDGDAVKERLKNDISGMEERKEKEKGMIERMEIMSQLSFARYAYSAIITEPTVPAITLDRIKEARKEMASGIDALDDWNAEEDAMKYAYTSCIEILDKLIAEVGGKNERRGIKKGIEGAKERKQSIKEQVLCTI